MIARNDDNFPLSTFLISWVIMNHSQFNKYQKTSYDANMYLQTADESMHWHNEAMPWWRKVREERKWQRRKRNMFRLQKTETYSSTHSDWRQIEACQYPANPRAPIQTVTQCAEYIIDITKWDFKLITLLIGTASGQFTIWQSHSVRRATTIILPCSNQGSFVSRPRDKLECSINDLALSHCGWCENNHVCIFFAYQTCLNML